MKKLVAAVLATTLLSAFVLSYASPVKAFSDVDIESWYSSAVDFVVNRGLFNGISDTSFSPDTTMTRAMFATVLGRFAGVAPNSGSAGIVTKSGVNLRAEPNTESAILNVLSYNTVLAVYGHQDEWYKVSVGSQNGYIHEELMVAYDDAFKDVENGNYYSTHVQWSYLKAIAAGTTSTNFFPEDPITREQICSFLYNYANSVHLKPRPVFEKTTFTDDSQISADAKTAVYTMMQAGVIFGKGDNVFDPRASATRAEVAAMIMRFVESVSYKPEAESSFAADGSYIYGTAVPTTTPVSDSFFDDACFIGHSFVVGMRLYLGLPNASFYGVNGMSAAGMLSYNNFELSTIYENEKGETLHDTGTIVDVLRENSEKFKKIYIALGTNELSSGSGAVNTYYNNMSRIVDAVRGEIPDAEIFLLATFPVTKLKSEESQYFNRDNVIDYNTALKKLSIEKNVYYVDTFTPLIDSDGYLPVTSGATDGIHILSPQYAILKKYLVSHTTV